MYFSNYRQSEVTSNAAARAITETSCSVDASCSYLSLWTGGEVSVFTPHPLSSCLDGYDGRSSVQLTVFEVVDTPVLLSDIGRKCSVQQAHRHYVGTYCEMKRGGVHQMVVISMHDTYEINARVLCIDNTACISYRGLSRLPDESLGVRLLRVLEENSSKGEFPPDFAILLCHVCRVWPCSDLQH